MKNNSQQNIQDNNKLDLSADIFRMTPGVSLQRLWGLATPVRVVGISHQMMQSSILVGEVTTYVQDVGVFLRPKVVITVSNSFANSPITMGIISKSKYIPFLVVKLSRFQLTEPHFLTLIHGESFMINPKLQERLIEAARAGNIIAMKKLVRSGANPFAIDWEGESAITIIAGQDSTEGSRIIEELADLAMGGSNEK